MKIGTRGKRQMMGLIQGLISRMTVIGRMMERKVIRGRNQLVKRQNHYVFIFLNLKRCFMTNLSLIFIKRKKELMIYG
jgi:hypothetical protein